MLRLLGATALAVALLGVTATAAPAHQGNPNFRSVVRHLTPALRGVDVDVVNYDDSLEMHNHSGRDVIVQGYRDEPFLRISADGTVAVNRRSPTGYLNDDRFAEGVQVPKANRSRFSRRRPLRNAGVRWRANRELCPAIRVQVHRRSVGGLRSRTLFIASPGPKSDAHLKRRGDDGGKLWVLRTTLERISDLRRP